MVQAAGPKSGDDLVQTGADARHLRLGDARVDTQRGDQIVHGSGRDAGDVGLHHHRVQRLIDAATGFEDQWEERALAQLRDAQVDVTRLGRQRPRPGAIAFGDPCVGAFVAGGADHVGRFGFDELLQHHADRFADQIHGLAGA